MGNRLARCLVSTLPAQSTPTLTRGLRACPSVNMSQIIGETDLGRHSISRIPPRLCTASRHFRNRGHDCLGPLWHSNQSLPRETPSEMLRYPHRAPWCFCADRMPPHVCWWNRTTASKPTSTNIIKVAGGKRYWPHLRVRCLSRGGPGGHYRYPADRVPLRT
jgi:hypothetical protein